MGIWIYDACGVHSSKDVSGIPKALHQTKIILIVFTVLELLACMAGIAGKYLVGEETKLKVMTILLFC